jgi:acetate kinase
MPRGRLLHLVCNVFGPCLDLHQRDGLDEDANARNATTISLPESHVEVRVVPTDEESVIARHALEIIHL